MGNEGIKDFSELFPLDTLEVRDAALVWRGGCPDVTGEIFLNGPAGFGLGAFRYRHWLDGDGYVKKITLGKNPTLKAKYISTKKKIDEAAAGRPVHRTFGTSFYGDKVSQFTAIENPANINVTQWGNDLLAWGEGGLPFRLDSHSLDTIDSWESNPSISPFERMSGHPKECLETGSLVNFSVVHQDHGAFILFREFSKVMAPGELPKSKLDEFKIPVELAFSIHDFSLTQNYALMVLHPYFAERDLVMKKNRTILESLKWSEDLPTRLLVVPRVDPASHFYIEIPSKYVIHWVDCQETKGRHLICEFIEYERPFYDQLTPLKSPYKNLSRGRCQRIVVDIERREVTQNTSCLMDSYPDFPAKANSFSHDKHLFWCLGMEDYQHGDGKFFNQLVCTSLESNTLDVWRSPNGSFLGGEPIFVEGSSREQMFVAVQFFSLVEKGCGLHFFDPMNISNGPVGSLQFPSAMPFGLHGFWRESYQSGAVR